MAAETYKIQGLIVFVALLLVYIHGFGSDYYIHKVLFQLPYYLIPVILVVLSSTAISNERESGMLDLIRLCPVRKSDYILAKVLFPLIQYFIIALIFFLDIYFLGNEFGDYFITVNFIGIFGLYLIIFMFLLFLNLTISALMIRQIHSLSISVLILGNMTMIQPFIISLTNVYQYSPLWYIRTDLDNFYLGAYPSYSIWGGWIVGTIMMAIVFHFVVGRIWRGGKQ